LTTLEESPKGGRAETSTIAGGVSEGDPSEFFLSPPLLLLLPLLPPANLKENKRARRRGRIIAQSAATL